MKKINSLYKFSIFLPVRNGGHHFKQCVRSILEQTNQNFNLIVLDNLSTDGSLEWIYTLNDSRIIIYESKKDLSIEENWARILSMPKNEFMTIIGHDDLLDKNYLDIMSQLIESNNDAGLYQAHFRLIDTNGNKIRSCRLMPSKENADAFLESRFVFERDSFGTGYIFRSMDYDRVGGIPLYKKLLFADDALWLMLMMNSYKATANDECFSYRLHNQSVSYAPDWNSLLDALETYLLFLKSYATIDKKIAVFLNKKLGEYIVFWFQWAYFGVHKDKNEKTLIKNKIYYLAKEVSNVLIDSLGKEFNSKVNQSLFGFLARCKWHSLHTKNRIKNLPKKISKILMTNYFYKSINKCNKNLKN
jgi:glycosyltransferase involved in cell wall biosynthesis